MRYRYYLSLPLLDGRPEEAGSISRVPAGEIEHRVVDAVRRELAIERETTERELIEGYVARVEVHTAKISVELREVGAETKTIQIPWRKPPFKRRRQLLAPASGNRQDPRPIRADARARLITALSRSRRWLDEMLKGSVKSIEEIANREDCSPAQSQHDANIGVSGPRDRQGRNRWTATPRRRDFAPFRSSAILARTVRTAWYSCTP